MAKTAAEVETIAKAVTVEIKLQKNGSVGSGVIVDREPSPRGDLYTLVTNRHVVCENGTLCKKLPADEIYSLGLLDNQRLQVKAGAIKFIGKNLDLLKSQSSSREVPVWQSPPYRTAFSSILGS
jgi:S1-C subfamily serine protease